MLEHPEVQVEPPTHKSDEPVSRTMSKVCAGVPIDIEPEYEASRLWSVKLAQSARRRHGLMYEMCHRRKPHSPHLACTLRLRMLSGEQSPKLSIPRIVPRIHLRRFAQQPRRIESWTGTVSLLRIFRATGEPPGVLLAL